VRLDLTERIDRTAFMTGGLEHHWLPPEEGSGQGLKRIGYEVESEAALAEIPGPARRLGHRLHRGRRLPHRAGPAVAALHRPGGFELDLFTGMAQRPVAPVASGVALEKFLHGGGTCRNWTTPSASYREVLGFKPSDWMGNAVAFLRCGDRYTTRPSSSAARRTSPCSTTSASRSNPSTT